MNSFLKTKKALKRQAFNPKENENYIKLPKKLLTQQTLCIDKKGLNQRDVAAIPKRDIHMWSCLWCAN